MKKVISLVTMFALVVSFIMSAGFVASGNDTTTESKPSFVYGGEEMSATQIGDNRFAVRMSHTAGERKYMYYSERVNVNDLTIAISQMSGYHDFINIMLVGGDVAAPKAFGDTTQPLGLDWHMHCSVVNNVLNSDNMLTCDVANTAGTGVFGNLPIRSAGSANQPIAISLKKEDDGKWYNYIDLDEKKIGSSEAVGGEAYNKSLNDIHPAMNLDAMFPDGKAWVVITAEACVDANWFADIAILDNGKALTEPETGDIISAAKGNNLEITKTGDTKWHVKYTGKQIGEIDYLYFNKRMSLDGLQVRLTGFTGYCDWSQIMFAGDQTVAPRGWCAAVENTKGFGYHMNTQACTAPENPAYTDSMANMTGVTASASYGSVAVRRAVNETTDVRTRPITFTFKKDTKDGKYYHLVGDEMTKVDGELALDDYLATSEKSIATEYPDGKTWVSMSFLNNTNTDTFEFDIEVKEAPKDPDLVSASAGSNMEITKLSDTKWKIKYNNEDNGDGKVDNVADYVYFNNRVNLDGLTVRLTNLSGYCDWFHLMLAGDQSSYPYGWCTAPGPNEKAFGYFMHNLQVLPSEPVNGVTAVNMTGNTPDVTYATHVPIRMPKTGVSDIRTVPITMTWKKGDDGKLYQYIGDSKDAIEGTKSIDEYLESGGTSVANTFPDGQAWFVLTFLNATNTTPVELEVEILENQTLDPIYGAVKEDDKGDPKPVDWVSMSDTDDIVIEKISDTKWHVAFDSTKSNMAKYLYFNQRVDLDGLTVRFSNIQGYCDWFHLMLAGEKSAVPGGWCTQMYNQKGFGYFLHNIDIVPVYNTSPNATVALTGNTPEKMWERVPVRYQIGEDARLEPVTLTWKKGEDGKLYQYVGDIKYNPVLDGEMTAIDDYLTAHNTSMEAELADGKVWPVITFLNQSNKETIEFDVEILQNQDLTPIYQPSTDDPGKDDPGKGDPGTDDPGKVDPGKDDSGKEDPGKGITDTGVMFAPVLYATIAVIAAIILLAISITYKRKRSE